MLRDFSDEALIDAFDVSRESLVRLHAYNDLLVKWQKAINIVSNSSVRDAWARHFVDSLQCLSHIPEGVKSIVDLGSGGGFPGMVIALMQPDLHVTMIDSDQRKVQFLKTVARELSIDATALDQRVEDALMGLKPDLITARGFAPLVDLFAYCLLEGETQITADFLLMKGRRAEEEIQGAQDAGFVFDYKIFPSQTESDSHILKISDVRKSV